MARKKAKSEKEKVQVEESVELDQLIEQAESEKSDEKESEKEEVQVEEGSKPAAAAESKIDDATAQILARYEERLLKAEEANREAEKRAREAERKAEEMEAKAESARNDVMNEVEQGLLQSVERSSTTEDGALAAEIAKHAPELVDQIPFLRNLIARDKSVTPSLREDSGDACGPCNRQLIDKLFVHKGDQNPRYEMKVSLENDEKRSHCKPGRICDEYIIKFVRGRASVPSFIGYKIVEMMPHRYEMSA